MSEETFVSLTNSGPITVYVKDGRIVRVRPLVAAESEYRPWTIEANGEQYSPPRKVTLAPYVHAERQRVYSDNRIKYPMKRVSFDPNGKRNQHLRGTDEYQRIGWDEALDIVSGEIRRVTDEYGSSAISGMTSSHHNWGIVGYKLSAFLRFFNLVGYTPVLDNPDSWEGWHWGASHAWGFFWRLGVPEQYDLLEDTLQHAEQLVLWSCDPDTTRGIYTGQDAALWRQWLKKKGVQTVCIDPFYNYTAAAMDAKWIAPRIGTDTALAMAIACVWLEEGTYDREYIDNRTLGFGEFQNYILGKVDGVAKTPGWAAEESGVPTRTIIALARDWAAKRTVLASGTRGGQGGACRQAFGTEWARMMVFLQTMQGLGKPGRSIWGAGTGAPNETETWFPGYAEPEGRISQSSICRETPETPTRQRLYRLLVPDAILNPPVEWMGEGFCGRSIEQQFTQFEYPMEGHSEIKLWYRYGGSFLSTMAHTNKWVRMYQSPKLEFVVNQDCHWQGETRFADIVLPACTSLEREDIGEWGTGHGYTYHASNGCNYRVVVRQQKAIEPLWESKSDYEIFRLISQRLGFEERFTEGNSEIDWCRKFFDLSDLPDLMTWEEFNKKGYVIINVPKDYKSTPALRWFAEGRPCDTPDVLNPKKQTDRAAEVGTLSGKIEFVSQSLTRFTPDDDERAPTVQYHKSWEGHHSDAAGEYPLQLITSHPRYTFHTHYDSHTPWLNEIPAHRVFRDGYSWWPVKINTADAAARSIENGDIVRLFNERASVLCSAVVTERVRPGVAHSYISSGKYEPLEPGNPDSTDKAGCVAMLTPGRLMAKKVAAFAPNSCLIQIEKWNG